VTVTVVPNVAPPDPLAAAPGDLGGVTAMEFVAVAESLADATRAQRLNTVGFSSSPAEGHTRTIRRDPTGKQCLVSVERFGRPAGAVVGDLVDGIIAANNGKGDRAALMAAGHNTLTDRRRETRQRS